MGVDYKILFKLELLSDYFTDERARHLRIVPTAETAALLRDLQILYKQLNNKFILLARTDDGKPYISIDPTVVFRFYMEVDNYFFLQYSNLSFNPASDQRYYFSNKNDNPVNGKNYLSKQITSVYSNATAYAPGDLVLNNTTDKEVFEAVHASTGKALTEPHYWYQRTTATTQKQYVHKGDLRTMSQRNLNVHLPAAASKAGIVIKRYNVTTDAFDITADTSEQEFEIPVQDVVVDLSALSTGSYQVIINSTVTKEVFVEPDIFENGIIGLVEIFNNLPPASPYSFLDATGKVKEPETKLSIRFANRLAYWRYIARTAAVVNVKEKNDAFLFTPDGLKFLSNRPLAFQEKPYNIVINYQAIGSMAHVDIENIKNASYQQVRKVSVMPGETFDCSEIYLNY